MKRLIGVMVVLVGLWALPAWAGSNTFRIAGSTVLGAGATRQLSVSVGGGGGNYDAIRQSGAGPNIFGNYDMIYPFEITPGVTQPLNLTMRWTTPDVGATDYECYKVCGGVIKAGASRAALDLTACSSVQTTAMPSQYVMVEDTSFSLQPKDTTGTICNNANDCRGSEMVIQIIESACGGGHSQTTNNRDMISLSWQYN